jgi:hypothetical protein
MGLDEDLEKKRRGCGKTRSPEETVKITAG